MEDIELESWLEKLRAEEKAIIVEGIKDKNALISLGITEKLIFTLSKKALFELTEDIADNFKEAIILTDFDKKGKELYGKLNKDLVTNGVKVDNYFREFLQKKTKLSHIEGIVKYLEHLNLKN